MRKLASFSICPRGGYVLMKVPKWGKHMFYSYLIVLLQPALWMSYLQWICQMQDSRLRHNFFAKISIYSKHFLETFSQSIATPSAICTVKQTSFWLFFLVLNLTFSKWSNTRTLRKLVTTLSIVHYISFFFLCRWWLRFWSRLRI